MVWVATIPEDDIPLGSCKETMAGEEVVLLVRTGQGIFACAPYCPHKAMHLETAEIDGTKLTCPLHAATFDLGSGSPDEDTDWAGTLPVYPIEIKDGVIHVEISS